jgi:hypothetical protein
MHSKVPTLIENQVHKKKRWKLGEVNYLMNTWVGFRAFGVELAWWVGQDFKLNDGCCDVGLVV